MIHVYIHAAILHSSHVNHVYGKYQ